MAFTTLFRTGEQVTEQMLQRILGQQYYGISATSGVGTGFAKGQVGIMNGATGSDPNHFSVQADGTDLVLTIRGGWAFVVKDAGTTSFDPLTYMVESSAPITYTVPSNSQGSTRVDTICLRIDQSISPDATGSNLPSIYNVQGGGSSALGNAPNDGALYYPLALVTIDNGETSLTSADVADKRQTTIAAISPNFFLSGASVNGSSISIGGKTFYVQCGTDVVHPDGSANFTITYPVAFANAVIFNHASNGDGATSVDLFCTALSGSVSATTYRAWNTFTNSGFASPNFFRANWIAIGY